MISLIEEMYLIYIVYVYAKYGGGYPKTYRIEKHALKYIKLFWILDDLSTHAPGLEKKKLKVKITNKKYGAFNWWKIFCMFGRRFCDIIEASSSGQNPGRSSQLTVKLEDIFLLCGPIKAVWCSEKWTLERKFSPIKRLLEIPATLIKIPGNNILTKFISTGKVCTCSILINLDTVYPHVMVLSSPERSSDRKGSKNSAKWDVLVSALTNYVFLILSSMRREKPDMTLCSKGRCCRWCYPSHPPWL